MIETRGKFITGGAYKRPLARWRQYTTRTKILFVFLFIFKFGKYIPARFK